LQRGKSQLLRTLRDGGGVAEWGRQNGGHGGHREQGGAGGKLRLHFVSFDSTDGAAFRV